MTTTRAIANDIGAAPISDHSCATPSNHSGMVVFPPSGRIRRYLRPRKLLFYPTPDRELAMRLENDFTPWSAWFRRHPHMALCRSLICARAALSMADRYPAAARGGECPSAPRPPAETGLIWLLQGREVAALTETTASIRSAAGNITIYRKHNKPALGHPGHFSDPAPAFLRVK